MAHFSTTYGMVGVGIAAAIGFVFALSFLSNTGGGGLNQAPQPEQSQPSTFSLKQQDATQLPSDNNSGQGTSSFTAPDGQSAERMEAGRINESGIRPTLTSVVALTGTRERILEISDGMKFKLGVPAFIQANLQNQNVETITNHTIVIDVKSQGEGGNESIANFHGDIAAGSRISVESYWEPAKAGDYVVTVFLMTPEDLASTTPISPAVSIPVKVVSQ